MGWLKGEVALITGGGSGLGWALVERFLEEGAHVGVLQRSQSKVDALKERFGDQIVAVAGDVANYADNVRAVQATVERFGKLDCFIGNAGIWDHYADIVNTSGEQLEKAFDEIMGINTKALILGAKAALDELVKSEGSIILTLSNSALYSSGGGPVYTASKHAGVGIMKELAYELAPKVRVNAVAPSAMNASEGCGQTAPHKWPHSYSPQTSLCDRKFNVPLSFRSCSSSMSRCRSESGSMWKELPCFVAITSSSSLMMRRMTGSNALISSSRFNVLTACMFSIPS